jgi:hypothetical protein
MKDPEFAAEYEAQYKELADCCKHTGVPLPAFNSSEAFNIQSEEVRKRFPRFSGTCPDCKGLVIVYASYEHYIAGDW